MFLESCDCGPDLYAEQQARSQGWSEGVAHCEPMLTAACEALAALGHDFSTTRPLFDWWVAHKAKVKAEADRTAARQAAIQTAMAKPIDKLLPQEKRLLREAGILR